MLVFTHDDKKKCQKTHPYPSKFYEYTISKQEKSPKGATTFKNPECARLAEIWSELTKTWSSDATEF